MGNLVYSNLLLLKTILLCHNLFLLLTDAGSHGDSSAVCIIVSKWLNGIALPFGSDDFSRNASLDESISESLGTLLGVLHVDTLVAGTLVSISCYCNLDILVVLDEIHDLRDSLLADRTILADVEMYVAAQRSLSLYGLVGCIIIPDSVNTCLIDLVEIVYC